MVLLVSWSYFLELLGLFGSIEIELCMSPQAKFWITFGVLQRNLSWSPEVLYQPTLKDCLGQRADGARLLQVYSRSM